ncbi:uncharacterized protein LOC101848710 [Aplysia californica]|uniref:Uncharacterized protein LOC101848710 n=1 Tax=Aplysia californica TaxID=6500 RepID=A0ABM1ADF2_APLCA|nr:uncharacterized protein LOC101848710 [Aplysia californica]
MAWKDRTCSWDLRRSTRGRRDTLDRQERTSHWRARHEAGRRGHSADLSQDWPELDFLQRLPQFPFPIPSLAEVGSTGPHRGARVNTLFKPQDTCPAETGADCVERFELGGQHSTTLTSVKDEWRGRGRQQPPPPLDLSLPQQTCGNFHRQRLPPPSTCLSTKACWRGVAVSSLSYPVYCPDKPAQGACPEKCCFEKIEACMPSPEVGANKLARGTICRRFLNLDCVCAGGKRKRDSNGCISCHCPDPIWDLGHKLIGKK